MWFDLYIRTGKLEETVQTAKELGWSGIGLIVSWEGQGALKRLRKQLESFKEMDIALGVEIEAKTPAKMKKLVLDARRAVELVAVSGGDTEVNRAAVETPQVDMLVHPWKGRTDSGLDHVMARLAKKNNVAVVFDFNELLYSSKRSRVQLMHSMLEAAKLFRKVRAPIVISSGARMAWDLRAPSDLLAWGRVLGFQDPALKAAMSGEIVRENRKRLSGKWVLPGVEIE